MQATAIGLSMAALSRLPRVSSKYGLLGGGGATRAYSLTPFRNKAFGARVNGFDLNAVSGKFDGTTWSNIFAERLKADLREHRMLVFSEQFDLKPETQVQIMQQFGPLTLVNQESAPDETTKPTLLSNDPNRGFRSFGVEGWHVDGISRDDVTVAVSLFHEAVVPGGATGFVALRELYEVQPEDVKHRWNSLWSRVTQRSTKEGKRLTNKYADEIDNCDENGSERIAISEICGPYRPLVAVHPSTRLRTLMLDLDPHGADWLEYHGEDADAHLDFSNWGSLDHGAWHYPLRPPDLVSHSRVLKREDLHAEIAKAVDDAPLEIKIEFQPRVGDYVIFDNSGLCHMGMPGTQAPPEEVGVRLVHRCSAAMSVIGAEVVATDLEDASATTPLALPCYPEAMAAARKELITAITAVTGVGETPKIPGPGYLPEEHAMWSVVYSRVLAVASEHACPEYLEALRNDAKYNENEIPDIASLDARLFEKVGWRVRPVTGSISAVDFFSSLEKKEMPCTTYIRPHTKYAFTEDPDCIHEMIGHIPALFIPSWAALCEAFGKTARRLNNYTSAAQKSEAMGKLTLGYVAVVEKGFVRSIEDGTAKAIGASVISGSAELRHAVANPEKILPVNDIADMDIVMYMGSTDEDNFVPYFFVGKTVYHLADLVIKWMDTL